MKWAIGENIDKAERPDLQNSNEYEVHWLRTKDVCENTCERRRINPHSLTPRQERNIAAIEKHVQSGGWLDPSEIRKIEEGCIKFEGRHRLVVAHRLGQTYTPFTVPKKYVEMLNDLIREK